MTSRVSSTRFWVPGKPVVKQRPRLSHGHVYTPATTSAYEEFVGVCAKAAGAVPLDGDVAITIFVFVQSGRHGDIDNYVKAVLDGLNGIAYRDDRQVVQIFAAKVQSATEGTYVIVRYLDHKPTIYE